VDLIAKLYREHAEILESVAALRPVLADNAVPPRAAYFELKFALARQLVAHLTSEDLLVYPRLIKSEDARVAETATRFAQELGGLLGAFKDWSAQWTYERAAAEWPVFRRETNQLLRTLTTRIERENRELYPFADGISEAA